MGTECHYRKRFLILDAADFAWLRDDEAHVFSAILVQRCGCGVDLCVEDFVFSVSLSYENASCQSYNEGHEDCELFDVHFESPSQS
jgi:hypothetical protein